MPKLIAGAHVSIAKGFTAAAQFAVEELSANALQLFLKSPRSGGKCRLQNSEAAEYREFAAPHKLFTVAHGSYLLNFAKDLSAMPWVFENLIDDLENIAQLGGAGVIVHAGKYLEQSRADGTRFIVQNLTRVLAATKKTRATIILENLAGQGTELCSNFAELATIHRRLRKSRRVKFCFDTAHAFAAGYDLRTPAAVRRTFADFDRQLGIPNLACIHFNDSKVEFRSNVDRHENLGKGKIGRNGLAAVARFARKHQIPLILETPTRDGDGHQQDLETLRSWLA